MFVSVMLANVLEILAMVHDMYHHMKILEYCGKK
jgi:hypothetical protein